jgi:hypothetical protein
MCANIGVKTFLVCCYVWKIWKMRRQSIGGNLWSLRTVFQFTSIFNCSAPEAPTAVIKLQKFMVNLRATRLNAFAAWKRLLQLFRYHTLTCFLIVGVQKFSILSFGIIFSLCSFFSLVLVLSFRFMNVWHERKEKWNQTVEKGVKYDNFVDSLSLVSAILISRHNFRYCSIDFVVWHCVWCLFGSVKAQAESRPSFPWTRNWNLCCLLFSRTFSMDVKLKFSHRYEFCYS